jgi:hypothetical protein
MSAEQQIAHTYWNDSGVLSDSGFWAAQTFLVHDAFDCTSVKLTWSTIVFGDPGVWAVSLYPVSEGEPVGVSQQNSEGTALVYKEFDSSVVGEIPEKFEIVWDDSVELEANTEYAVVVEIVSGDRGIFWSLDDHSGSVFRDPEESIYDEGNIVFGMDLGSTIDWLSVETQDMAFEIWGIVAGPVGPRSTVTSDPIVISIIANPYKYNLLNMQIDLTRVRD